jgi:hypothetical protein
MDLTTPAPGRDITGVFGELRRYARRTVRLHPRAGAPGPDDSSLGGPLRWPSAEGWPACREPHVGYDLVPAPPDVTTMAQAIRWAMSTPGIGGVGSDNAGPFFGNLHSRRRPDPPVPLVPVLQLYARDVPELPFPGDTDVLQVLWCPNNHDLPWAWCPYPVAVWRRAADVTGPPAQPPPTRFDDERFATDHVPLPCVLHPERVVEYPHMWDLPGDLRERVERWDRDHDSAYWKDLSTAPGTKVGGHPRWIQDPQRPTCDCGTGMEHLLTIASDEPTGTGTAPSRWPPVEDPDDRVATRQKLMTDRDCWAPHGLMLGDVGSMYLFTCTRCPDRPLAGTMQCT